MKRYRIRRGALVHVCAFAMLAALIAVPEPSPVAAATATCISVGTNRTDATSLTLAERSP